MAPLERNNETKYGPFETKSWLGPKYDHVPPRALNVHGVCLIVYFILMKHAGFILSTHAADASVMGVIADMGTFECGSISGYARNSHQ